MALTSQQRQRLKGLAHSLKPTVSIGHAGVTSAVLAEIDTTLETHELIKIRIYAAERDERKAMIQEICNATHAELIQAIGNIAAIYRKRKA